MSVWGEIVAARQAAHAKHGDNSIEAQSADSPRWLAILVEEIGGVANALTYDGPSDQLRAELIDVLAVASAWVDARDGRSLLADLCHNGHPFEPGVDTDMASENREPDPRWCNTCGEARIAPLPVDREALDRTLRDVAPWGTAERLGYDARKRIVDAVLALLNGRTAKTEPL